MDTAVKHMADKLVDKATLNDLVTLVTEWHIDRNLIDGASDKDQTLKLMQEVGELSDSVCQGKPVIDDIGDCMVILINIAKRNNLTLEECLAHAYKDIMFRTGRMVDGVFVKDAEGKSSGEVRPWISWNGGECPVKPDLLVAVKLRNGTTTTARLASTWCWKWISNTHRSDIIAYRIEGKA